MENRHGISRIMILSLIHIFQSAFQTRNIDASCEGLGLNKYYEGRASAPVITSLSAAYKTGDWALSGFFDITGGGGKASFDDGLPMFLSLIHI